MIPRPRNRGHNDKIQVRAAGDKVFDGRADAIRGAACLQGESDFAIAAQAAVNDTRGFQGDALVEGVRLQMFGGMADGL